MELKRINKTGSIQDIFFFLVMILGIALFILIVGYFVTEVTSQMESTVLNESAPTRTMLNYSDSIVSKLDYVFLIIFVGLIIGILISSFMIESHPIFVPIYTFLLGFAVVVGVIMGHVYDKFTENVDLAATAATHTFTSAIMDNFVKIIIGVGILSMIIIFAKARGREGRL